MRRQRSSSNFVCLAAATFATLLPSIAHASRPFITIKDDGFLSGKLEPVPLVDQFVEKYDATGAPRPDVISVWTAFTMEGDSIVTRYAPVGNEVKGIGLETVYGDDGTAPSYQPPIQALMFHNDFTKLDARAKRHGSPADGYGRYIFLLELSHLWGPAIQVPAVDGGTPGDLIGFTFHWSFWMDAGGSPAGGNAWKDNGNGTFTTSGQSPKTVKFSMLDLYAMGLADANEVPPFGLLENVVPEPNIKDPFNGRAYSKQSFPWFGEAPYTVSATRRVITIDDVIAKNGKRDPARTTKPIKLGIVLAVPKGATEEQIAALEKDFEPLASSLAPTFAEATGGRGSLEIVTKSDAPAEPALPEPVVEPTPVEAEAPRETASDDGGCTTSPTGLRCSPVTIGSGLAAAVLALVLKRRKTSGARG